MCARVCVCVSAHVRVCMCVRVRVCLCARVGGIGIDVGVDTVPLVLTCC